ncbi:MAG: aldehyde dehydrogenase family protein [Acidobacteria bacterium]|nr:aldehyde dehydrogenase family protein [Acidobacteriota bacterium]
MPIDKDLTSVQQARDLVAAAHSAQKIYATFSQERIDSIVEAAALAALTEKDRLGQIAVTETGYGVAKDKAEKNRFAAEDVHSFFRNLKTVGVINETDNLIEIADPRGVVAAIIPSTNPTSTAIFKILISLKSRNGVVLSPHPSAAQCINETTQIMRAAAEKTGAPAGLIGCLAISTLQGTEELMKHKLTSVILATGGIGLVKAAYSSGKPAFGVGPGNVPVLVERSSEVSKAVADILAGKTFDYGTICASEQAIVVENIIASKVKAEFISQGAHFCNQDEIAKLEKLVVLPTRGLNPKIVGKSPQVLAEMAGFTVSSDIRVLIVELKGVGRDYPLSMEKLSPILAYYTVETWQEGSNLCQEILRYGGMGHTIGIHSQNRDVIRQFGIAQPASRIIVNSPTTHGAIGLTTNLPPSMTLGCGSWGGNVTSDNISPIHLMDIKRVAFETRSITRKNSSPEVAKSVIVNTDLAKRIALEVIEQTHLRNLMVQSAVNSAKITPNPSLANPTSSTNPTEPVPLSDALIAQLVDKFLVERKKTKPNSIAVAKVLENIKTNKPEQVKEPQAKEEKTKDVPASAKENLKQDVSSSPSAKVKDFTDKKTPDSPAPRPQDFVCEDDVKQALRENKKIYISKKTILTPSARDLGEANEIFAQV